MESTDTGSGAATPSATPSVAPTATGSNSYVPPSTAPTSEGQSDATSLPQQTDTPAEVRRFKVTIDGSESEVDESELIKGYQRARAANQRFEEAAKLRRQADQLLQTLKTDPLSILTNPNLGVNFDEIAEKHLLAKLENEMLSPEERKAREVQRELEQYKRAEAERAEQEQARQFEVAKSQARANYERQFVEVLEKTGLPRTGETVARMARYLSEGLRAGAEPDLYDVAQLVREDMLAEQRSLIGSASDDKLEELLGSNTVEKIRKALLNKVSGQPGVKPRAQPQSPVESPKQGMDPQEWKAWIRKRAGI